MATLSKQEIKSLCEQYLRHKYLYYIKNEPEIEDYEFDEFEQELRDLNIPLINDVLELVDFPSIDEIKELKLDPKNIVDQNFKDIVKYPHLTPMLSTEKIKVEQGDKMPWNALKLFFSRLNVKEWTCELKYDGNGIEYLYNHDGTLRQCLTRGNKTRGLDKTLNLKHIAPQKLNVEILDIKEGETIEVRGEVVIDRFLWKQKYSKNDPLKPDNARNYVGGVINNESFNLQQLNDLVYVAYSLVIVDANGSKRYIPKTLQVLESLGFNQKYKPNEITIHSIDEFEAMYFEYKKIRETHQFLLDGIVIKYPEINRNKMGETSHHPKWCCAIKFPPTIVKTTLRDYEWTLSKLGELKPVALLEPVELDGVMVRRASAHNLGYIINKKLFPGSVVKIAKRGEIIPQIVDIESISEDADKYLEYYENFKLKK